MTLFLIASAVSAYLWSRCLLLGKDRLVRWLAMLVLWQALQLLVVHSAAALQLAGGIERIHWSTLGWVQVGVLALSCAWLFVWRPRRTYAVRGGETSVKAGRLPLYLLLSMFIVFGSYLVFAVNLVSSYPTGSDALGYHLPLSVRWLQEGSLRLPPSRAPLFSFPGNAEVGMMLFLATGHQALAPAVNWEALAVLVIAAYLLAHRLSSGDRIASSTAVLVLLSLPIVEFQTFSGYVDLYGTAFLLAGLVLFLHRQVDGSKSNTGTTLSPAIVATSALACGISIGTKPMYYLFAGACILAMILVLARERSQHGRSMLLLLAIVVVAALVPNAFWFVRAFQATGNPLYPLQLKLGHTVLLQGYAPSDLLIPATLDPNFVRRPAEWIIYPWTEWKRNPGYLLIPYGTGDGFGAAFATFVPLGFAFLMYRVFVRGRGNLTEKLLLLAGVGLLAAWWLLLHRMLRYALPLWVLAAALSTPLISKLQKAGLRGFKALVVCCLLSTAAISTFVPLHDLLSRIRTGSWTRSEVYGYPKIIDQLPAGSRLLNATNVPDTNFPLAGARLTNYVVSPFETAKGFTPRSIQQENVDYLVEVVPRTGVQEASGMPGAVLVDDELIKSGETVLRWRVWKISHE